MTDIRGNKIGPKIGTAIGPHIEIGRNRSPNTIPTIGLTIGPEIRVPRLPAGFVLERICPQRKTPGNVGRIGTDLDQKKIRNVPDPQFSQKLLVGSKIANEKCCQGVFAKFHLAPYVSKQDLPNLGQVLARPDNIRQSLTMSSNA